MVEKFFNCSHPPRILKSYVSFPPFNNFIFCRGNTKGIKIFSFLTFLRVETILSHFRSMIPLVLQKKSSYGNGTIGWWAT